MNPSGVVRLVLLLAVLAAGFRAQVATADEAPRYETRPGSPDGIGKWYLGREIAHYMSHLGAPWLERPEREVEEAPDRLVQALRLGPGQVVADVGAGSGYLTWRMARAVGPAGRVYAVDIQPEMLAILSTNMAVRGITNVVTVLGAADDPRLTPASVDLAILVDVYHEVAAPYEFLRRLVAALKPGGRVVFVEYRGEERWIPIKPLHKMTEAQVRREMAEQDLEWVGNLRGLPRQHILVFRRPTGVTPETP